jgi:hypothetical protein
VQSPPAVTSHVQLPRTSELEQHQREVEAIIQKIVPAGHVCEDGLVKEACPPELKQEVIRQRLAHMTMVQERYMRHLQHIETVQRERRRQQFQIAFQKEQQPLITLQNLAAKRICQATADRNYNALERIDKCLQRLRDKELADEQRSLHILMQKIYEKGAQTPGAGAEEESARGRTGQNNKVQ